MSMPLCRKGLTDNATLAAKKKHDFDIILFDIYLIIFFMRTVNPIQNSFQDFITHVLNNK